MRDHARVANMMNNSTDRLCGVFFMLFGLILFFYLIPTQIEAVEYGSIRPKTMPQILSVIIGVFGAALMFKPADGSDLRKVPWGTSGMIVGLLFGGLWLMAQVSFEISAPPLALILMLVMGERRPIWLGIGVLGMPTLIWFAVTVLLERSLP